MNMYLPIAIIVFSNIFYHICSKSTPKEINPFASLIVTYLIGAFFSTVIYFATSKGSNLLEEYHKLNWSSLLLGLAVVGLEAGSIYMYKAGWNISAGQLVYSTLLTICLLFIGVFFYKEPVSLSKILGVMLCMTGLFFINR